MRARRRAAALDCGLALFWILGFTTSGARADDEAPKLRAHAVLEPSIVGLDELVSFSVNVESPGFGGTQITPEFELDNLAIVAGPFQSRSQRWVNGETSSTVQLTWRLKPSAVGAARVRSIRLLAGDSTIELPEREIQVQAQAPPGREAAPRSRRADPFEELFSRTFPDRRATRRPATQPKLFLRAELSTANPFVGQQTVYTLWLYTQSDIGAFQPTELPDFHGFWVREIPQPSELKPEWVEERGERFGRVPMLRRALFPLQAGKLVIEPTAADVVATIADFGPFGSPFGRNESFHLKTEPMGLTARPLPPAPGGALFQGPVGEVALSARLDRTELDGGQAATLTVRCTGRGNLQSLAPPALPLPAGIRGFPPRQSMAERQNDGALVASAEWSYVIVPEQSGQFEIAGLEIPYFDPASGEFRQATTPPLALTVRRATTMSATVSEAAADSPVRSAEETAGTARQSAAALPWGERRPALRIAALAAGGTGLALLLLWPLRRGTARSAASKPLLAAIAGAASEPSPRQSAAALEEAWRQHLFGRFGIPPSTPVSQWSDRLIAARADRDSAQALAALAHELLYLRYAPELSAADHLLADALACAGRLAKLRRLPVPHGADGGFCFFQRRTTGQRPEPAEAGPAE